MNGYAQFKLGVSAYREAHQFIFKHKLYLYFLIPIAFNLIFLFLFSGLIWRWAQNEAQQIFAYLQLENANWENLNFLKSLIRFAIVGLIQAAGLIIYMLLYKNLILILLSPLLSLVAEKITELISHTKIEFEWIQFIKNILRGISISIRNFIKELLYTLLFLTLSFVPILGWMSPIFIFAIQSFFYGSSIMDYVLELKNKSVQESEQWIGAHKWMILGLGVIFNLLVLLSGFYAAFFSIWLAFFFKAVFIAPVFILSIFPIYSVTAATIAGLKILDAET